MLLFARIKQPDLDDEPAESPSNIGATMMRNDQRPVATGVCLPPLTSAESCGSSWLHNLQPRAQEGTHSCSGECESSWQGCNESLIAGLDGNSSGILVSVTGFCGKRGSESVSSDRQVSLRRNQPVNARPRILRAAGSGAALQAIDRPSPSSSESLHLADPCPAPGTAGARST